MVSKLQSNLIRLCLKDYQWKSNYYAKISEEYTLYSYNDLEIRKYLDRIFKLYGILIHENLLKYTIYSVKIVFSYYLTLKSIYLLRKKTKPIKTNFFQAPSYSFNVKNFIDILFESLSIYTKNRVHIIITCQNLNKGLSLRLKKAQLESFRNIIVSLRKHSKSTLLKKTVKETINVLVIALRKKNSSRLLAEFIAYQLVQLNRLKKQNFFLLFIKQFLMQSLNLGFSNILGLKIIIKGRMDGSSRAKRRRISIGAVSLQTQKAKIDYSTSTAFTRNGAFGIKVWVHEN